jgi:hypothetical protein
MRDKIFIKLKINEHFDRICYIPGLANKIIKICPGLRKHKCDNFMKQTFMRELKNTELAHVLEHLMIENLLNFDKNLHSVSAWTSWNWKKNPKYSYTIEIEYDNLAIIKLSLGRATTQLKSCMTNCFEIKYSHEFLRALNNWTIYITPDEKINSHQ